MRTALERAALLCFRLEYNGRRFHWSPPDATCTCYLCRAKRALERECSALCTRRRQKRP